MSVFPVDCLKMLFFTTIYFSSYFSILVIVNLLETLRLNTETKIKNTICILIGRLSNTKYLI